MAETKKGLYKATGNIAVDMVSGCINHYARQGRRVAYIRLDGIYWTMFKGYVLELIPGYDLLRGEIDFDGVVVSEGSRLQIKPMYWELIAEEARVYLM